MNVTNENYILEGYNKTMLEKDLINLSDSTECIEIIPQDIVLYSVESICKEGLYIMKIEPDYMDTREIFPLRKKESYYSTEGNYFFYGYERMEKDGFDFETIEDIKEVGFYMEYKGEIIIPATFFMPTFCRQIGIAKLPDMPDPIREVFIGFLLRDADNFKMVYRKGIVNKALACFSINYKYISQMDAVTEIIEGLKDLPDTEISNYCISQTKTQIKFVFSEMKMMVKVGDKKKKISPSVVFSLSDTGDSSYMLQNYISINGRGVYIGEPVSLQHRSCMQVSDLIRDYKKSFELLKTIVDKINNTKDKSIDFKSTYITLLDDISFSSALGSKLYEILKNNVVNKTCSTQELLIDILDITGLVNKISFDNREKPLPESTIQRCEKQIGMIFKSTIAAEVFGW